MPKTQGGTVLYSSSEIALALPTGWSFLGAEDAEFPKCSRLPVVCDAGHQFRTTVVKLFEKKQCPTCAHVRKMDPSHALQKCETGGLRLLDRLPTGRYRVECLKRGHAFETECRRLKKGCSECHRLDKSAGLLDGYVATAIAEGLTGVVIEGPETVRGSRISFTCPLGHRSSVNLLRFKKGNRCTTCNSPKAPSLGDVRASLRVEGWELTEGQVYTNNRTPLRMVCDRGHQRSLSWNKWTHGVRCDFCKTGRALTVAEVVERVGGNPAFEYVAGAEFYVASRDRTTKMTVECRKKGHVTQVSYEGLVYDQRGCSVCNSANYSSKVEDELVELLAPHCELERHNRSVLSGLELDILVPRRALAVEYCGLYSHCDLYKEMPYHRDKWLRCKEQGITLLTIFEDEYIHRGDIVRSMLLSRVGRSETALGARECSLIVPPVEIARDFLEKNHLQGWGGTGTQMVWGLENAAGELVCALTLSRHHRGTDQWLINRFCVRRGHSVPGGFSRLLAKAREWLVKKGVDRLYTFSDNRWSAGGLYASNGFLLDGSLKPDYCYVRGTRRYSKQSLKKTEFERGGTKTERELRLAEGYRRIYDCGKDRWVLTLN